MPAQEQNQTGGEAKKSKKGCLIGCLVALGVVVILVIGFVVATPYIIDYMMGGIKKSIVEKLPEGYDREKLERAYSDFVEGIKSEKVTQQEILEISNEVTEALADGELTEKELDELIEKANKASEN